MQESAEITGNMLSLTLNVASWLKGQCQGQFIRKVTSLYMLSNLNVYLKLSILGDDRNIKEVYVCGKQVC